MSVGEAQDAVILFSTLSNAIRGEHERLSTYPSTRPRAQAITQAMDRLALAIIKKYGLNESERTFFRMGGRIGIVNGEGVRFKTIEDLLDAKIGVLQRRVIHDTYFQGMDFTEINYAFEQGPSVAEVLGTAFVPADMPLSEVSFAPQEWVRVSSELIEQVKVIEMQFRKVATAVRPIVEKLFLYKSTNVKAREIVQAIDRLMLALTAKYSLHHGSCLLLPMVPREHKMNPNQLQHIRLQTTDDLMDAKIELGMRRGVSVSSSSSGVCFEAHYEFVPQFSVREALNIAQKGIMSWFDRPRPVLWGKADSLKIVESKLSVT